MYIKSSESFFQQGFLSDLLKKANRHYDDQKLQEYTQTIVSSCLCGALVNILYLLVSCLYSWHLIFLRQNAFTPQSFNTEHKYKT